MKIKDERLQNAQNKLVFRHEIGPKMHSEIAIFANSRPDLALPQAKSQGATWRLKTVPAGTNRKETRELAARKQKRP